MVAAELPSRVSLAAVKVEEVGAKGYLPLLRQLNDLVANCRHAQPRVRRMTATSRALLEARSAEGSSGG